ncbi:MAG: RNA polymerase sigma factor [Micromonosporaceae bacterium]
MRDSEMVAGIIAGEAAALTAAYDCYAAGLYAYCRSLLGEPADGPDGAQAADALKDTFIVAAAELTRLRDPGRLRAWLYAVARNECLRRTRAAVAPSEAPDSTTLARAGGATADVERSEARELVAAALAAMNPGERDVAELNLRHGLDDTDLAATLGVSRRRAQALASRARGHFAALLGALLAAASPELCPELGALLTGSGEMPTAPLLARLDKHIQRCSACAARRQSELQPVMALGLAPNPALPGDLWPQVRDAVDSASVSRADITQGGERFGFPVPLGPSPPSRPTKRFALAMVGTVAALAVLGAGIVIATGMPHTGGAKDGGGWGLNIHAATTPTARQARPTQVGPAPAASAHATPTARATEPIAAPVGTTRPPNPPAVPPTPTQAPTAPTTLPGVLTASSATVTLQRHGKGGPPSGSFMLTALGGPVALFTITVPSDVPNLTVTPLTGAVGAGQSVQVSVTLQKPYGGPLDTQLIIQPGGLAVGVIYAP